MRWDTTYGEGVHIYVMGQHDPLKGTGLKVRQHFDVVQGYAAFLAPDLGGYNFPCHHCSVLSGWEVDWLGS